MTSPVIRQTTTVSQKVAVEATRACRTGSEQRAGGSGQGRASHPGLVGEKGPGLPVAGRQQQARAHHAA